MKLRKFAMGAALAGLLSTSTLLLAGDEKPVEHKDKDHKAADHKGAEHKEKDKAGEHKTDGQEKKKQ